MNMQFNPNDLVEYEPVDKGDYEFVVVAAEDSISKNGNEMISLELQCEVGRDKPITVYDQLVSTAKSLWVLKSFCRSVSPSIDFESGQLEAANCIGATGIAHLVLGEENKRGRRYMEVEHYVAKKDDASEKLLTDEATAADTNSKAESPEEQQQEVSNDPPF